MVTYRPRIVDDLLVQRLTSAGAVLIEGPKACGKTFTAQQQAASSVYLDTDDQARAALGVDPALVLSGDPPQLIDEWQLDATRVWNHVRAEVAEIERVRADDDFVARAKKLLERDREILGRLAK